MNVPSRPLGLSVEELFAPFGPADDLPEYAFVAGDAVPPPYHDLLVHNHHMTVTVEAHHGDLVDVRILDRRLEGDSYTRKIVLALQGTGRVVQFGVARVHLNYCSAPVREAIVAGRTPLGRILIQHNVLRFVEPTGVPARGRRAGRGEVVRPEDAAADLRPVGGDLLRRPRGHRGAGNRRAGGRFID